MKKNDKVVVALGVVILLIAAIGIYFWAPGEAGEKKADIDDFLKVKSEYKTRPTAISIDDKDPYHALVVTPVAVNYDCEGNKFIAPLYIENNEELSNALINAQIKIGAKLIKEISDKDAKNFSLYIADKYWEKSDAALIIENNEAGYSLGVMATPLASYLSIPIIVTDEMDEKVTDLLDGLKVKKTIICGDLDGYGEVLRFDNIDDIVNMSIDFLNEKFKSIDHDYEIDYITLTNPRDAFPPDIIEGSKDILVSDEGILKSGNLFPSHLIDYVKSTLSKPEYTLTIPDESEYKYALVKVDVKNLQPAEDIEQFGDGLFFGGTLTNYMRSVAYPAKRDANGNIEYDRFHFETVLYDAGGEEYTFNLRSSYSVTKSAEYEILITVEGLENPYYPMMKQFSSVAPYLTAHHQGLIYGKPDFAFAQDDTVKLNGEKLPGNTQAMFNPILIPVINQHVYENVHIPLNNVLAKIKDIDITNSVEYLKEECDDDPFYIALVGDSVMLPQYYYRSPHSDPFENPTSGMYATNTPSDYIYGNIDPEIYSLLPYEAEHVEDDIYSDFPEVENIVGRITGWNVQDASTLIARTVFYDEIIDDLGEWKDNALFQVGAGTEMQKLPIITFINSLLGDTEPQKFPSGEKYFLTKRIVERLNEGDFTTTSLERGAAQRVGLSNDALLKIKKDGLLNRLLFPLMTVKIRQGYQNKDSLTSLDWWFNALFGDGAEYIKGGEYQQNSNLIISDSHAIWFEFAHGDVLLHELGMRPNILYTLFGRFIHIPGLPIRTSLDSLGAYSVRDVCEMDMGPSVMLIEGCGSGKIDGFNPELSIANAYLHAGVNAFISPTTFSAFYGALEPRFGNGVGFGIVGYLKTWLDWKLKGQYPPIYFNQYMFEHMNDEMFEDDIDIGYALRNAKNDFLPAQFEEQFRWVPPLLPSNLPEDVSKDILDGFQSSAGGVDARFPVEKYATIYQLNLLGDPAFNPYEPINEG